MKLKKNFDKNIVGGQYTNMEPTLFAPFKNNEFWVNKPNLQALVSNYVTHPAEVEKDGFFKSIFQEVKGFSQLELIEFLTKVLPDLYSTLGFNKEGILNLFTRIIDKLLEEIIINQKGEVLDLSVKFLDSIKTSNISNLEAFRSLQLNTQSTEGYIWNLGKVKTEFLNRLLLLVTPIEGDNFLVVYIDRVRNLPLENEFKEQLLVHLASADVNRLKEVLIYLDKFREIEIVKFLINSILNLESIQNSFLNELFSSGIENEEYGIVSMPLIQVYNLPLTENLKNNIQKYIESLQFTKLNKMLFFIGKYKLNNPIYNFLKDNLYKKGIEMLEKEFKNDSHDHKKSNAPLLILEDSLLSEVFSNDKNLFELLSFLEGTSVSDYLLSGKLNFDQLSAKSKAYLAQLFTKNSSILSSYSSAKDLWDSKLSTTNLFNYIPTLNHLFLARTYFNRTYVKLYLSFLLTHLNIIEKEFQDSVIKKVLLFLQIDSYFQSTRTGLSDAWSMRAQVMESTPGLYKLDQANYFPGNMIRSSDLYNNYTNPVQGVDKPKLLGEIYTNLLSLFYQYADNDANLIIYMLDYIKMNAGTDFEKESTLLEVFKLLIEDPIKDLQTIVEVKFGFTEARLKTIFQEVKNRFRQEN